MVDKDRFYTVLTIAGFDGSAGAGIQADLKTFSALDLLEMGPQNVVVKGGHLDGNCDDCLVTKNSNIEIYWLSSRRIQTKNKHGTGCTFSAAIASFLAKGFIVFESVSLAKQYLTKSIEAAANIKVGQGNGPVHHFHHLWNDLTYTQACK